MSIFSYQQQLSQAIMYFKFGYFEGSLRICRILENSGTKPREASKHLAWLSRVHLGGNNRNEAFKTTQNAIRSLTQLTGGQGIAEVALLAAHVGQKEIAENGIRKSLETADAQHGVIVTWHPTALLELAQYSLDKLDDRVTSIKLVNCALGFRAVFVVLDDVERLAHLLIKLQAPFALWADWCAIFIRHLSFCTHRARWFANDFGDEKAVLWAQQQDDVSEGVLARILQIAPVQLHELLIEIAPHFDGQGFADVLRERFPVGGENGGKRANDEIWYQPDVLRLRYFWHDMITEGEQSVLCNGDWSMFNTPTTDYSMSLAQWWRLTESILKRTIAKNLSDLFAANPEWLEWDLKNLTERVKKRESVFLEKLSDPKKAEKLTLVDLIRILQKCVTSSEDPNEKVRSGSKLRREAEQFLNPYQNQLGPLVNRNWMNPLHLTEENINFFRNRSSHDAIINIIEGSTGRLLAKRVLDLFFTPVLVKWGFVPVICT